MSVSELKESLREVGLAVSGRKEELGRRLSDYESQGWEHIEGLYYIKTSSKSSLIASFDLDGNLIRPHKAGAPGTVGEQSSPFAVDENDFVFTFPLELMLSIFKCFKREGFKFVLFTNQMRKQGRHTTLTRIYNVTKVFRDNGIEFEVYVSTEDDIFRKPNIGMFEFLETVQALKVDREGSFFVGDAAGRLVDHSDSDLKFAENAGMLFFTPEQFFGDANPDEIEEIEVEKPARKYKHSEFKRDTQELVLFSGPPGCGKSTFFENYFQPFGYFHANQDTLKTKAKVMKVTTQALKEGKSVVIDATNPSKEIRKEFIDISKKLGVPVRIFGFDVPIEVCKQRNNLRGKKVPGIAYNVFKSKYQKPELSEGVEEIVTIKD